MFKRRSPKKGKAEDPLTAYDALALQPQVGGRPAPKSDHVDDSPLVKLPSYYDRGGGGDTGTGEAGPGTASRMGYDAGPNTTDPNDKTRGDKSGIPAGAAVAGAALVGAGVAAGAYAGSGDDMTDPASPRGASGGSGGAAGGSSDPSDLTDPASPRDGSGGSGKAAGAAALVGAGAAAGYMATRDSTTDPASPRGGAGGSGDGSGADNAGGASGDGTSGDSGAGAAGSGDASDGAAGDGSGDKSGGKDGSSGAGKAAGAAALVGAGAGAAYLATRDSSTDPASSRGGAGGGESTAGGSSAAGGATGGSTGSGADGSGAGGSAGGQGDDTSGSRGGSGAGMAAGAGAAALVGAGAYAATRGDNDEANPEGEAADGGGAFCGGGGQGEGGEEDDDGGFGGNICCPTDPDDEEKAEGENADGEEDGKDGKEASGGGGAIAGLAAALGLGALVGAGAVAAAGSGDDSSESDESAGDDEEAARGNALFDPEASSASHGGSGKTPDSRGDSAALAAGGVAAGAGAAALAGAAGSGKSNEDTPGTVSPLRKGKDDGAADRTVDTDENLDGQMDRSRKARQPEPRQRSNPLLLICCLLCIIGGVVALVFVLPQLLEDDDEDPGIAGVDPTGAPGDLLTPFQCEEAAILSGNSSIAATTKGAPAPGEIPVCSGLAANGFGSWFQFIGDGSVVSVSTCDPSTDFDTQISIFTGSCSDLECVAANDQGKDASCGSQSDVEFSTNPDEPYYVFVHGKRDSEGEVVLNLEYIPQDNDSCDKAGDTPTSSLDEIVGNTWLAAQNPNADNFTCTDSTVPGLWYAVEGQGKEVTISTCSETTKYNAEITVASGTSCDELTCTVSRTEVCPSPFQGSIRTFFAVSGATYFVKIHGSEAALAASPFRRLQDAGSPADGQFGMVIREDVGDAGFFVDPQESCEEDLVIEIDGEAVTGSLSQNSNFLWDSVCDGDGQGQFFRITGNGRTLQADTCNDSTGIDSTLSVITGDCSSQVWSCVASNDQFCGDQSSVKWFAEEGETYYLLLRSVGSIQGSYSVSVITAPTPAPSLSPSDSPTDSPSDRPTAFPTRAPSDRPTGTPTRAVTPAPTRAVTPSPTNPDGSVPTLSPTNINGETRRPTTPSPTNPDGSVPTLSPTNVNGETRRPTTAAPTDSNGQTRAPSSSSPDGPSGGTPSVPTLSPTDVNGQTRAPSSSSPDGSSGGTPSVPTLSPTDQFGNTRAPTPTTASPTDQFGNTRAPTPTTASPTDQFGNTRAPTPTTASPTDQFGNTRAPSPAGDGSNGLTPTTPAPTFEDGTTRAPSSKVPSTLSPTFPDGTTRTPTSGAPIIQPVSPPTIVRPTPTSPVTPNRPPVFVPPSPTLPPAPTAVPEPTVPPLFSQVGECLEARTRGVLGSSDSAVVDVPSRYTFDPPFIGACGTSFFNNDPGVWFKLEGPVSGGRGIVFAEAEVCQTTFDFELTVFAGTCDNLMCVAGTSRFCTQGLRWNHDEAMGTYYLMFHGFGPGARGNFVFNVDSE